MRLMQIIALGLFACALSLVQVDGRDFEVKSANQGHHVFSLVEDDPANDGHPYVALYVDGDPEKLIAILIEDGVPVIQAGSAVKAKVRRIHFPSVMRLDERSDLP